MSRAEQNQPPVVGVGSRTDVADRRMMLTCYNDTFGYGWKHVDLFTFDSRGQETNWVHWTVEHDGPLPADRVTTKVEPTLLRVSDWRHHVSEAGMDYWEADAEWAERS